MIASALMKCDEMHLVEFYGSRSRLEEEGLSSLGEVFSKQKSIVRLNVSQNGSKKGLKPLLNAMCDCSETLEFIVIEDNKSINRAIPELVKCLKTCKNLKHLSISDLNMRKKFFPEVTEALLESLNSDSKLETLIWNYDLSASNSTAKTFLTDLGKSKSAHLKKVSMTGVFQSQVNRHEVRDLFTDRGINLELFKPNFTDDESEDNDCSEEESQAEDLISNTDEEEENQDGEEDN